MTTEPEPAKRALMPAAICPPGNGSSILKLQSTVPECARQKADYEHRKRAYGVAVSRLFATGYQATDAEYKLLKMATEDARIDLEAARLELERYTRSQQSAEFHGALSRH